MAFGQDFLKSFFGNDYLKDYTHASKTFRTNGYSNSPRFKFLFHVYFNLNTDQIPKLRNVLGDERSTIGLLVKNIELPKYQMDVETMNQYNRKRLIQKKINYQPVKAVLHDDGGDLIRTLWYNYYSYYYKDPTQKYNDKSNENGSMGVGGNQAAGFSYNSRDIYADTRAVNDWGYVGESYSDSKPSIDGSKPPFFRDISIYGFNQHKFVEYLLVNPLITEWNHDQYDYAQGDGVMENTMTIAYETVKYYTGDVGKDRASTYARGFADPNTYDQVKSPLSRPGGTRSILGQGGLLDTGIGIYEDLQSGSVAGVIGAVQKAGTAYNTWKGANLKSVVKEEAISGVTSYLTSTLPGQVRAQPSGGGTSISQQLKAPLFPTPTKTSGTT